jgi:hypothetical protein
VNNLLSNYSFLNTLLTRQQVATLSGHLVGFLTVDTKWLIEQAKRRDLQNRRPVIRFSGGATESKRSGDSSCGLLAGWVAAYAFDSSESPSPQRSSQPIACILAGVAYVPQ